MKEYTIQDIDQTIEILDNIREYAINDPEYGFNDNWVLFMKKMRLLTTQSSGSKIQNYIFRAFGWERVKSSLNRGDIKNSLGQYFEFKESIITSSNPLANIVQIRLWQNISGHQIIVIDATKNYEITHFTVPKYDMAEEVKLYGNNAHGTKEANKNNQNIEWAIRINWKPDNEIYKRWINKYKQDSEIGIFKR